MNLLKCDHELRKRSKSGAAPSLALSSAKQVENLLERWKCATLWLQQPNMQILQMLFNGGRQRSATSHMTVKTRNSSAQLKSCKHSLLLPSTQHPLKRCGAGRQRSATSRPATARTRSCSVLLKLCKRFLQ